jgi:hypothetical protein
MECIFFHFLSYIQIVWVYMVEPTRKGMQVLSHLVFYKNNVSLCLFRLFSSDSHPNSRYNFCLEELHRRPVIIRPASICTLSSNLDYFLMQLPHTSSPYSKIGLINAKYIRIREYISNKCLICLRLFNRLTRKSVV